jgi:hypothetical protein
MDSKGTNNTPIRSDSLLYNEDYFKYIFKKTEKILSAVLYTTRSLSDEHQKDILVRTIEDKSIALLTLLERTLTVGRASQVRLFEEFRVALIALEGALTMLTAGRVMREDLLEVFRHELSTLHRSLRDYIHDTTPI